MSRRSPGLLRVLRETDPEHVLVDGTLAECDGVGGSRTDCSPGPVSGASTGRTSMNA
ncbi:hypothetical protein [Streptomyces scopuliridis]|uniref:hypothetical protein n=1 Tax=Streptomyces scopuliridis TaxID=452529 RepID=UPI00367CFB03